MIDYCNSKIELGNINYRLFGAKGKALMELEKYDYAIHNITQAIELNPKYALGFYNRGVSYYFIQEYDLAIKDLKVAKDLDCELSVVNYYLGACYFFIYDYEKAIDFFSNYLLKYYDINALKWRADIYVLTEQYEKANADIFKLLADEIENIEYFEEINSVNQANLKRPKYDNKPLSFAKYGFLPLKKDTGSGIYILKFNNNEYYIGQTKNVKIRIKQHLKKYKDILKTYFKPISENFLLQEESETIAILENNGFRILSKFNS